MSTAPAASPLRWRWIAGARTPPIHAVIRGAADKEPFAAALGRRLLDDRLAARTERIRTYLPDHLRPELSVEQASQRYVVPASPELYYLLTAELGWTPDEHRAWLVELLRVDLLGHGASASRSLS